MSPIQPVQSSPTQAAAPARPPTPRPEANDAAADQRPAANTAPQDNGANPAVGTRFNALA